MSEGQRDELVAAQALVRCAECGREVTEDVAQASRWAHWASGTGQLHPFCGRCAEDRFGIPADELPASG